MKQIILFVVILLGIQQVSAQTPVEYNMSNSTVADTVGILYDDGGKDFPYTDNQNLVFTITPSNGKEVTIRFDEMDIETNEAGLEEACIYDFIEIFDGADTNATSLGQFCGNTKPGPFTASGPSLTVRMFADGGTTGAGFKMVWSTGDLPLNTSDIYCQASGPTCGEQLVFISEFSFNDFVNPSSFCDAPFNSTVLYSDFTDSIITYNVGDAVTIGGLIDGALGTEAATLYIDWNQNGSFDDAGEMTPLVNTGAATGEIIGTLTPPAVFEQGFTRMRLRVYDPVFQLGTSDACSQTDDGEVEDYTLLVLDPAAPLPECTEAYVPSNSQVNVCTSVGILNWSADSTAVSYNVYFAEKDGQVILDSVGHSDTSIAIPGLISDTTYRWIVTAVNDNGSAFNCDTVSFQTAPLIDPIVNISPTMDTTFSCIGSDLGFTGVQNYPNNITHTWSGPAAAFLDDATIENPIYNNNTEDTLKLFYEARNDFGCGGLDSTTVITLDGARLDDFQILNPDPCFGDSVFAVVKGAIGEISFEDSLINGMGFNPLVATQINDTLFYLPTVVDTHFVRLNVSLGDCDIMRDTIRVETKPIPQAPIISFFDGELGTGCQSEVSQGPGIGMRMENFQPSMFWSDQFNTSNDTLYTSGTGVFFATNVVNGCESTSADTLFPVVFQNPVPTISRAPQTACEGDSLVLSIEDFYASQEWNVSTDDSAMASIVVFEDGTYTVDVIDTNGCAGSASEMVTFFAKPSTPSIQALDAIPACSGSEVRLEATYDVAGAWSNGETTDTIFVSDAGTFSYASISPEGCSTESNSIEVSFFESGDKINVSVSPKAPYCEGDQVTLVSEFENGNTWSDGTMNDTLIVTVSGVYQVQGMDENGCSLSSDPRIIEFGAFPGKPTISRSGNTLTCDSVGAVYEWLRDGIPLNQNSQSITATQPGNYVVRIFNGFGCESEFSDPVQVITIGIAEQLAQLGISFYPNPVSQGVLHVLNESQTTARIELLSTDGKSVLSKALTVGDNAIEMQEKGAYILRIYANDQVVNQVILVQ